jgi:hypothetical protein
MNSVFYFITFVLTLVWCAPPPGGDHVVYGAKPFCQTDARRMSVVQSGFNIGSDLYLGLIPIPLVARLVFALGLL